MFKEEKEEGKKNTNYAVLVLEGLVDITHHITHHNKLIHPII